MGLRGERNSRSNVEEKESERGETMMPAISRSRPVPAGAVVAAAAHPYYPRLPHTPTLLTPHSQTSPPLPTPSTVPAGAVVTAAAAVTSTTPQPTPSPPPPPPLPRMDQDKCRVSIKGGEALYYRDTPLEVYATEMSVQTY